MASSRSKHGDIVAFLQSRLAVIVGLVIIVGLFLLPDFWKDTRTPLQPGGSLVFGISEASPRGSKAYPLRVILHKKPEGILEIQVKSEHGERFLTVDRNLQPADPIDNIEFPLALGGVLEPGALWISSSERAVGGMSAAGLVRRVVRYKAFKAVEVEGVEGGLRFFEVDTGLLVGFEVKIGRHEIVGSLLSLL